jgi:hypothetical protein
MKRVARKGLVTAMVAGGVLASAGYAQADSAAGGETADSPGVLSGNTVQAPVDIPVNVCGNTINVIGLLNPSMGNGCATGSDSAAPSRSRGSQPSSGARPARRPAHAASASGAATPGGVLSGGPREGSSPARGGAPARTGAQGDGAQALGGSGDSPGVLAGNVLGLPIHLPVNLSGNSANVVGIGNPSFGNTASNNGTPQPAPVRTRPAPPAHQPIPAPPNVPDPVKAIPAGTPGATAVTESAMLAHTGSDGLGWAMAGSAGLLLGGGVLHRRSRTGR